MNSDEVTRLRQHHGGIGHTVSILLVALPIWGLAYLLDVHIYLGIRFTLPQYIGGFMALVLALTYLLFLTKKTGPSWRIDFMRPGKSMVNKPPLSAWVRVGTGRTGTGAFRCQSRPYLVKNLPQKVLSTQGGKP
jgi:hypothetical protein